LGTGYLLYGGVVEGGTYLLSSLWEKNAEEGELCNDLTGRRLGRRSLTNSPQKEHCGETVYTVLCTGLGV